MAKMFRRSQRRLPADLATGDVCLDARLQELDAHLAGSAAVRRPTLQEARDFLFEARDRALAAGRSPAEAAAEAVAALGDVGEIAAEQRSRLRRAFWTDAITSGLVYGTFMTAFNGLQGDYDGAWSDARLWLRIAGEFGFRALFFGVLLSYTMNYLLNPGATSSAGGVRADGFEVGQGKRYRGLAWLMAALGAASLVIWVATLSGHGPFGPTAPLAALFMAILSAQLCLGMIFSAMFRAWVTPEALSIRGLLGHQRIARDAVIEVRELRIIERFASIYAGPSIAVDWRDPAGNLRRSRIPSTSEIGNIDRLRAWLDDAIEAGRAR